MPITCLPVLRSACFVLSAVVLTACASTGTDGSDSPPGSMQGEGSTPDEVQHVHGIVAHPDGDGLILGTHHGILHVGQDGEAEPVGPVMDFMGLSDAGPGRLVASGHPGPGTDMPNPVGLIESTDGGRTWEPLSRVGESDFHALAATEDTIIGFDGVLRATDDGEEWFDLDPDLQAIGLTVSEDAETVLATTQEGLRRSEDGGRSFDDVGEAPPLVFVDWVRGAETVYGVDAGGTVHRSEDTGRSWSGLGSAGGQPEAIYADADQVALAVDGTLVVSSDGGKTFDALGPAGG
ncbi:F510_1955 family glycosylhydrolase [Nocardiopsis nanhaiensis]